MDQELDPSTSPLPRAGASLAGGVAVAGRESLHVESHDVELPMVVWLRGDEPYCEEFVWGADEVMAELGIKRSRLTQISGRELRVGRMRLGRYVRPVYRPCDVRAYKEWTRPTASHQRSADALQAAADALAAQARAIAQKTQDPALVFARLVKGPFHEIREGITSLATALKEERRARSAWQDERRRIDELERRRAEKTHARLDVLESGQARLESLLAGLAGRLDACLGALDRLDRALARAREELERGRAEVPGQLARHEASLVDLKLSVERLASHSTTQRRSAARPAAVRATRERSRPPNSQASKPKRVRARRRFRPSST